jgi:rhodanese-related sulfurtransferase
MELVTFIGNHPILVALAITLAAVIITVEIRHFTRKYAELGIAQAVRLVNDDAVVVDVRSPERFQTGHIGGARNIPLERLADDAEKRVGAKDRPILTYCDNGLTGARAAALLGKLSYSSVSNLRGGLEAWRREGYPLERK